MSHIIDTKAENSKKLFVVKSHRTLRKNEQFRNVAFPFCLQYQIHVKYATTFLCYDVIKASLICMSCLKAVWKEGQNCSNPNRYISGTNWNFCIRFLQYDP